LGDWILAVYKRSKFVFGILGLGFLAGLAGVVAMMGFTPETIQTFRNVLTGLEGDYNANSVYLQWFVIDSYVNLLLFVPLSMFSFLFSPLLPMGANPLSLVAVMENVFLLFMVIYAWWPTKGVALKRSRLLQNALLFSIPLLLVYAFGVADSGTAIRQKGFLILIIVYAFFKKIEWRAKEIE
jgi:hypothetical protein